MKLVFLLFFSVFLFATDYITVTSGASGFDQEIVLGRMFCSDFYKTCYTPTSLVSDRNGYFEIYSSSQSDSPLTIGEFRGGEGSGDTVIQYKILGCYQTDSTNCYKNYDAYHDLYKYSYYVNEKVYNVSKCSYSNDPSECGYSSCPTPMIEKNGRCVANPDLNKTACESQGGYYVDPKWAEFPITFSTDPHDIPYDFYLLSSYGSGCLNMTFVNATASIKNIEFFASGFLIDTGFLFRFAKSIFARGKKLWQWISDFIGLSNKKLDPKIYTNEPEIIDVEVVKREVVPKLEWKPSDPIEVDGVQLPHPPTAPDIDPGLAKLLPNPKFVDEFKPEIIHGADLLRDKRNINFDFSAPIGQTKTVTVELNDALLGIKPKNYELRYVKEESIDKANYVLNTYSGRFKGTNLKVKTQEKIFNDGIIEREITVSYPLKPGHVFEGSYKVVKNVDGTYTKTSLSDPTISFVDDTGQVQKVTNTGVPLSKNGEASINLLPLVQRADQIISKVDETNNLLKSMRDYVPPNANDGSVTLDHFTVALLDWSSAIDSAFSYVDTLKSDLEKLTQDFQDMKEVLQDKPKVNLPSGQCGFTATFYHHTYQVDPCKFVAPYRSILETFFTLLFSFMVFKFAIKRFLSAIPGG